MGELFGFVLSWLKRPSYMLRRSNVNANVNKLHIFLSLKISPFNVSHCQVLVELPTQLLMCHLL